MCPPFPALGPQLPLTNTHFKHKQVPMNLQLEDVPLTPYLQPVLPLSPSQVEILELPLGLGCVGKKR